VKAGTIAFLALCLMATTLYAQNRVAGPENLSQPQPVVRNPALLAISAAGTDFLPKPADIPEALLDEAIAIILFAVVPGSQEAASGGWEAKELKYTIPGTPVSVRLLGQEVVVVVSITPYRSTGKGLMLVAQGQVWYKDGESVHYRTTFDTINLLFGERVYFYPFGMKDDGSAPLRVELIVNSYRNLEMAWTEYLANNPQRAAAGTPAEPAAESVTLPASDPRKP